MYRPPLMPDFQVTPEIAEAMELMGKVNCFLTGRAGCSKTTTAQQYIAGATRNLAVVAPTGVAALNAGGVTIHSFFDFGSGIDPAYAARKPVKDPEVYKCLEVLAVDEVSMLWADLMDCIDAFLRRHGPQPGRPFGGVTLLLVGDLYQLSPVATSEDEPRLQNYQTPYFFGSTAYQEATFMGSAFHVRELTIPFRQHEVSFLETLDAVREGTVTDEQLDLINQVVDPRCASTPYLRERHGTVLCTRRNAAAAYNQRVLASLDTEPFSFWASVSGAYRDPRVTPPADYQLTLKVGARVMFLRNNRPWWVNGSLGTVVDIDPEGRVFVQESDSEKVHEVKRTEWEHFHYRVVRGELVHEKDGSFWQLPLGLAWGATIHKSQGLTLNHGCVDLGDQAFAFGQVYVALSRFRTMGGLSLKRSLRRADILVSPHVKQFMADHQAQRETESGLLAGIE